VKKSITTIVKNKDRRLASSLPKDGIDEAKNYVTSLSKMVIARPSSRRGARDFFDMELDTLYEVDRDNIKMTMKLQDPQLKIGEYLDSDAIVEEAARLRKAEMVNSYLAGLVHQVEQALLINESDDAISVLGPVEGRTIEQVRQQVARKKAEHARQGLSQFDVVKLVFIRHKVGTVSRNYFKRIALYEWNNSIAWQLSKQAAVKEIVQEIRRKYPSRPGD
jgi:hypothetical protein